MNFSKLFQGIIAAIALLILADYALPGREVQEKVERVSRTKERYYNAAQNSHFSFKLVTKSTRFSVSEGFASTVGDTTGVRYWISPVFNEIQVYQHTLTKEKEYNTLHFIASVLIPVLGLLFVGLEYKFQKYAIAAFVVKILVIGSLVFHLL